MPITKPPKIIDQNKVWLDSLPTKYPYQRKAKADYIKGMKSTEGGGIRSGGKAGEPSWKEKYKTAIQAGKDYREGPRSNPNYVTEATAKAKATRDAELKKIGPVPKGRPGTQTNQIEAAKKKYRDTVAKIQNISNDGKKRKSTTAINKTRTAAASGKGAAGPAGPDTPKKDAKRKADAEAVAKWNAAIEENKRIAEEERKNNNNGNGGNGGGSAVPSVDRGMFERAGQQAISRVNAVYAGEDARTRALMAQNTASNTVAAQQLAAGLSNRYADMQKTQAATTADLAAQGFGVGNSAMGGQYQLEALQNAGNAQQAYMTQMQQMNALNESSRLADNSQARSAYEHGINANVADSYNAALVAAQEAAASAAKSGASSAGKQVLNDQRQFNYDQDVVTSMFAGQPNFQGANRYLDTWKGMEGPRIVAARQALRYGLRNPGQGMSPQRIRQRWGGNQVNRMVRGTMKAQNTAYKPSYDDILNYQQAGRIR